MYLFLSLAIICFSLNGCISMMVMAAQTSEANKRAKTLLETSRVQHINFGVYDISVPTDSLCELWFLPNIISINGKTVNWFHSNSEWGYAQIPSGKNTIVFNWIHETPNPVDYDSVRGEIVSIYSTTTSSRNNITFPNVEMAADHKYLISGGMGTDRRLRTRLIDVTNVLSRFLYGDNVPDAPKKSGKRTQFNGTWQNNYGVSIKFSGNTWMQTTPPMTAMNETSNQVKWRGTFEDTDGILTLYVTEVFNITGKMWGDATGFKEAFVYKYSFNGNKNLLLERLDLPKTVYIRQ